MYRNQTPNQLTTADFSCIFPVFQTFSCKFWLKLLPFARLWSDSNEIRALSFFRRAGLNRAVIFWFFSTNHSTANHISLKLLPFPCFRSDSNEIQNLSFFRQVPLNRAVIFWFFSTNHSTANHLFGFLFVCLLSSAFLQSLVKRTIDLVIFLQIFKASPQYRGKKLVEFLQIL